MLKPRAVEEKGTTEMMDIIASRDMSLSNLTGLLTAAPMGVAKELTRLSTESNSKRDPLRADCKPADRFGLSDST